METRTLLLVLTPTTLLLGIVLALAGGPAWGWGGVLALGAVTALGALATPKDRRG